MRRALPAVFMLGALAACTTATGPAPTPPAPGVKLGRPYTVDGVTYTPEYAPDYDETGMASWYGPGFHGRNTADGEIFDQDGLTAAHPTLPLPCLVRVTNLENGRQAIVRVNDRGPFKDGRLIDLSHGAARALGITGLARVRVQYLRRETEEYWAKMNLKAPQEVQLASNDVQDSIVPQDADAPVTAVDPSPQIKQAAPIMSVAADNVKPGHEPLAVRLGVVSEAEAAEPLPEQQEASLPPNVPFSVGPSVPAPSVPQTSAEPPPQEAAPAPVRLTSPAEPTPWLPPREAASAPASQGGWYVQAGSFSSAANAQKLAEKLGAVGKTEVTTTTVNGAEWHRVRLGPFAGHAEAQNALLKAEREGAAGAELINP